MSQIGNNILQIKSSIPSYVSLIAVSKYHSCSEILDAYQVGQRIFGENIVQELCKKFPILPQDIEWHFIGHLQKNKVKYIVPFIKMIHSVDSYDLLKEIDKHAKKWQKNVPCLLQLHVGNEETKFGFTASNCIKMLEQNSWKDLRNISISGIMGIATHTQDETIIQNEFHTLKNLYNNIKDNFFKNDENFRFCSWGMSSDYPIAIKEGSNMIRIGTTIFGERSYSNRANINV